MKTICLTEEQVKAVIECLDVFVSEREFAKEKYPTKQQLTDFAIYAREAIADSDMESVQEVLKLMRESL